jgi:RNA-directed DNA polymerase
LQSPLISFESLEQLEQVLASYQPLSPAQTESCRTLTGKGLPPIVSAGVLGAILGVNPKLLTAMAKFPDRYYRRFSIRKKSGGRRPIMAPRTFLKTVQQYILEQILSPLEVSSQATGFVKGRGTVANGATHQGASYLLNVDIKNFFHSISEQRVREFFLKLEYPIAVARLFMRLCTYQGSLPQGAPTSPSLSNLVFAPVDGEITKLSGQYGLRYSRYADDLTFSGPTPISKGFLRDLRSLLRKERFTLNRKKTRFARPGQAKYVTGLIVNERVQAPRELRRKLRAMFHRAEVNPSECTVNPAQLLGWASFVNSYDPKLGLKYLEMGRRFQAQAQDEKRKSKSKRLFVK